VTAWARPGVALALLLLVPVALRAALGPRYGGELTVGVLDLPPTLEPAVPRGPGARLLAGLVGEGLVGSGPDAVPTPSLAESWAASAAGREWTLTLRPAARFQDDTPLTSEATVRSLRRFLRGPGAAAAHLAETLEGGQAFRSRTSEDLPGLSAPDPRRVVLRTDGPRSLPLLPLASPAAAITSPTGAGAGPFVPTVVLPGRRVVLTAFGGHTRGRPYLDRVQVVAVPDSPALHTELRAGRIDLASGEPGVSALAATLLLILDPAHSPFDRPDARTAVAGSIDRVEMVAKLIPGGDPAPFLLVPGLLPALGAEAPRARAPSCGTVAMAVSTDVPPLLSQRVVAHLVTLGLTVRVVPANPATVREVPAAARLLLWSPELPEAGLALEELAALAPDPSGARALLAAAARELDLDRRRVLLYRAEAGLRAENILVPLGSVPLAFGGHPGVHGPRLDLTGRLCLEDAWIEP
jgi:peptide/nickel transport system substrate-binding protein